MRIGSRDFATTGHTYIMGILNVTPDSFSDGGKFDQIDAALKHAEEMIRDGADVIDIGGESTRPGYTKISDEEETDRVVPVIEAVKKEFGIPISVDTYKSGIAEAAAQAGADLINDIWGLKYDPHMSEVIAKSGLACCLMHNRDNTEYRNFMEDVKQDLRETIALAKAAGIADDKIILDPGVGFAKSYENNLEVIRRLKEFNELKYPVLLGTSRKSVIGLTLDLPAAERVEGTIVTTVMAVEAGWFSTNILGNRDGEVLDDPANFKTKEVSKLSVIDNIFEPEKFPDLYGDVYHKVRINYYPPRKDNKEAWDNIDIFGWMGYPMEIKVNFLCRDSILAAPIALDLVLFSDLALRAGMYGIQTWLSFFCKSPMHDFEHQPVHDLFQQWRMVKQTLRDMIGEKAPNYLD